MNYRTFKLACACGKVPKHIWDVGLTSEEQIVFHWRCPRCRNEVFLLKHLADLFPGGRALNRSADSFSVEDVRFLHLLGVKWTGD